MDLVLVSCVWMQYHERKRLNAKRATEMTSSGRAENTVSPMENMMSRLKRKLAARAAMETRLISERVPKLSYKAHLQCEHTNQEAHILRGRRE